MFRLVVATVVFMLFLSGTAQAEKSEYISLLQEIEDAINDILEELKKISSEGNKVKEISDEELEEIRSELDLSYPGDSGFTGSNYYWITDEQLKEALNKEIDSENAPGLTYGVYILNAINEMELIESVWSQRYKIEASAFFNKMIDINTGWSSLASSMSQKTLTGIARGGTGVGMSSLFMAGDAAKVGISLKALKKVLFYNSLWYYLDARYYHETHQGAWEAITTNPVSQDYHLPINDPKKLKEIEKYFENLWDQYGEHLSGSGLDRRFKQQSKEELRAVLFSVLEKSPTSEKSKTPEPPIIEKFWKYINTVISTP